MVICLAVGFFVGRKEEIIMKEKKLIKEGQKGKHSQRTREVVQDSTKSAETSCKEETTMRRPEDTATPAEIIAMMQKEYPHLNPRLGRADDPELSELMVYFKPESTKSKTHTQKKNRGRT
jgi:FtsZ-interacting cell division protein ZipA